MKIFVSGSIGIKSLPHQAALRLASIVEKGFDVLIGDAGGVDYSVQKLLSSKGYHNVMVYHVGDQARHNVNNWQTKRIAAAGNIKGRALYTLKDEAMADDADYALMVWDGKSKGTFNNMLAMHRLNKRFLVIENGEEKPAAYIEDLIKDHTSSQLELFPNLASAVK